MAPTEPSASDVEASFAQSPKRYSDGGDPYMTAKDTPDARR